MNTPDDETEYLEGCPDCGQDTIIDQPHGTVLCTACGWRD